MIIKMTKLQKSKENIYIIGAGGHGIVVLDLIFKLGLKPSGFLDDNKELLNKKIFGVKVIGEINLAKNLEGKFIVAIGDNRKRLEIVKYLSFDDNKYLTLIHPSTIIGSNVKIGRGSMIIGGVVINPFTTIGRHTIINTSSSLDHHNRIGDFVHIAPGVHIGGNVEIKNGSFIGIGASIMPNIKIGKWDIIGAGSVIINNIPDSVTVVGVPGKIIK